MIATLQITHLKSLLPHHHDIEEFIYTQLDDKEPEIVTHEFLHACGNALMEKVSNELLRTANSASGGSVALSSKLNGLPRKAPC